MSFVIAAPGQVQAAAQDLSGIRSVIAEAASSAAGPTTGLLPAAADEVSAAISATFGNFGQEFQGLSAQAQAFHAEFVRLLSAGARAYLSTEIANAEQAVANAINEPAEAILGSPLVGAGAAQSVGASGLLGGLLGGGTSGGSLLGGLTGGTSGASGLLGGLTGGSGGLLGGLTGGGGLLGGVGSLGGVLGSLGSLGSLGPNLGSLLTGILPGLPTTLGGLTSTLTGVVNSLLPGIVNVQAAAGPYFTGIAGPYEALFYNTWVNLNSLTGGWLADPFPFLRQFVANQIGYGQTIVTAFETGNYQPVSAIPGEIAHNFANVIGTLTNTRVTSSLVVQQVLPTPSLTLDNAVGLPLVFGASLLGPPAATLEAAGYAASLFESAVQAGNGSAAFAALVDAPAYIANGFLNGQATYPYALNLSSLTGPAIGGLVNVTVVANFPLDGILHPPGYYPVTATVTALGGTVLPPVDVNLGAGSTPFSGLLPFLVNYAPEQLAQAIGAPAAPPPLISIPLLTF
ncbi:MULTISPECIES: PE family protein [unclassified Mycobacterium]|uniref:PE family protein n=1 Tax=unclassified Mycobacterium TaxID=2642494 RepID=UPI000801C19C|nr:MULTISPECIES: PE family protein [unclassified Mycobacterium]OBH04136.1 hypothetical protein A5696_05605 [Mycobacterium sp. E2699]OBI57653.1 hypothetical protein A5705_19100 [Mycobacterium sp. E787]